MIVARRRAAISFPGRTRGFTLLEVMIALVLAAIALGGLTVAVSQMINGASSMTQRTYASWIAQNRIAELRLANVVPEVDITTSEVQYANLDWQLQTTISETGVENLFRIDVEVTLAGDENPMGLVTGFIGEPTLPGDANAAWNTGFETDGAEQ